MADSGSGGAASTALTVLVRVTLVDTLLRERGRAITLPWASQHLQCAVNGIPVVFTSFHLKEVQSRSYLQVENKNYFNDNLDGSWIKTIPNDLDF